MAKKKNKFDKIELNENYIDTEKDTEEVQQEASEEKPEKKKDNAGRFTYRKTVRKPKKKRERAKAPTGLVYPHFLMLSSLVLSVIGYFAASNGLYKGLSENYVYIAYVASSVVIYLLPCVIYCLAVKRKPSETYVKGTSPSYVPLLVVSLLLLISSSALIKYYIAYNFNVVQDSVLKLTGPFETILIGALLPAVCEETLIRGVLQAEYSRFGGGITGIFACAAVFAFFHFDVKFFVLYFAAGLILGVVTHVSGSVLPAMIMHFVNNMAALFLSDSLTFIAGERIGGAFMMIFLAAISFIFLLIQLQMMEKSSLKKSVGYLKNPDENTDVIRFFPTERATVRRFLRLVFSPAMILGGVICILFYLFV